MEERFSQEKLEGLFKIADFNFRNHNVALLAARISENVLCGALARELQQTLSYMGYEQYHVEVPDSKELGFCLTACASDNQTEREKLMVILMRRSTVKNPLKNKCREKLAELTGEYALGVFYVVDFREDRVCVETYSDGEKRGSWERGMIEGVEL